LGETTQFLLERWLPFFWVILRAHQFDGKVSSVEAAHAFLQPLPGVIRRPFLPKLLEFFLGNRHDCSSVGLGR
jgi:hypothetical protein